MAGLDLVGFMRRHAQNRRIVEKLAAQGVTPETVQGVQALAKPGEATMALLAEQLIARGVPFQREYRFQPPRRWRLDFYFNAARLAVEIDGGVHRIRRQFGSDVRKHNAIERAGLALLRFTPEQVRDGSAVSEIVTFLEDRHGF